MPNETEPAEKQKSPILEARGLGFCYDKRQVLADIDFQIFKENAVALLGASGIGKTTLIRLLSGLLLPTTGEVLLNGSQLGSPTREVGVMFQRGSCFPWLTAWQNLLFPLKCSGLDKDPNETERAKRLAKEVGLGDSLSLLPREMSGGMVQRLALARSIIARPQVLMLDEPFSALDPVTKMKLHELLRRLQEEESFAYVLITHDDRDAVALCDRIDVIHGVPGKLSALDYLKSDTTDSIRKKLSSMFRKN